MSNISSSSRSAPRARAISSVCSPPSRSRRDRDELLGDEYFGEPVWTMLLMLLVAEAEGDAVAVSSLCSETGVPEDTAQRWIATMTEEDRIAVEDGEARLNPVLAQQLRTLL